MSLPRRQAGWLAALLSHPRPGLLYWRKRKQETLDEIVTDLEELSRNLTAFSYQVDAQCDDVRELRDAVDVMEEIEDRNHAAYGRDRA